MARNWYGEKKIIKDDMYIRKYAKESDLLWEKIEMVLWIFFGYLYFHFIVMGWTL